MTAEIGVGMLGHAFMGRAHSNAYLSQPVIAESLPLRPRLVAVCGRSRDAVTAMAERFGYERAVFSWEELAAAPDVELFDNGGPNDLHAEPTMAAARAGKHVLCEKPLGRNADEAYEIWRAVAASGVVGMVGFNYRFLPAVRLAREMLEAGELGPVRHFRARYLQSWDPERPLTWRMEHSRAGSGALGDLGSHIIDLGRYLVGELEAVQAVTRTFIQQREGGRVTVDDAFSATATFAGGAIGTLEASRVATGRRNGMVWEINGERGSLVFDLERPSELEVYMDDGERANGFRRVLVTDPHHTLAGAWWPPGHMLGWEHAMTNEIRHLLSCIASGSSIGPHGATFEDGYRAAEVAEAILRSADTGSRIVLEYRSLPA